MLSDEVAYLKLSSVDASKTTEYIERAAMARTTFYPGYARWMQNPTPRQGSYRTKDHAGRQLILPTLAVNTGGWMEPVSDDLSAAYVRAQRDLSCHYVLGFQVQTVESGQTHEIRVAALGSGKEWETLLALEFPLPEDVGDGGFEFLAELRRRDSAKARHFQRRFPVPPVQSLSGEPRLVTLLAHSSLRSGDHSLTLALSEPGHQNVATTKVEIDVPSVPKSQTFILGPVLARVIREGILISEYQTEAGEGSLDEFLRPTPIPSRG